MPTQNAFADDATELHEVPEGGKRWEWEYESFLVFVPPNHNLVQKTNIIKKKADEKGKQGWQLVQVVFSESSGENSVMLMKRKK